MVGLFELAEASTQRLILIRAGRQRWRLSGATGELILGLHLDQQIDDGADQARRLAGFVAAHAGGHGIE
jgi:hypothetical protein